MFDLLNDENMGLIREKRETEKKKGKETCFFSEFAKLSKSDAKATSLIGAARSIFTEYYCMRSDIFDITAFSYEGTIRIFKTENVANCYKGNNLGLVDKILISLDSYQHFGLNQNIGQAKTNLEYQIDWMKSGTLTDLFAGELPPSLGTDNARIARKVLLESKEIEGNQFLVIGIITNDRNMVVGIKQLLKSNDLRNKMCVTQIPVAMYVWDCNFNCKTNKDVVVVKDYNGGKLINTNQIDSLIKNKTQFHEHME